MILAIHPYLPVPELQRRFGPLADYLSRTLGRKVSIRIGGNYDEHIEAIGKNKVDIAFLGPAGYVKLVSDFGKKPLLARFEVNNNPYLYGVIATRKGSKFKTLADLRNSNFAFGDPESTMSHLVPRYMLIQAGIPHGTPAKYNFLGSHRNVALGILAGDYDAGAMKKEVFDEYKSQGLRALAVTPGVPDHVFVARDNMPAKEITRLRHALIQLADQPDGTRILHMMHKHLSRLVPAKTKDYDQLREMIHSVETTEK
jgi:phosphonate transport system substrate-binding protein